MLVHLEKVFLLDFLEKPGASQLYSLEPLDTLARAYQNANRHDDALGIFEILQKELPKLAYRFYDLKAKIPSSDKASASEAECETCGKKD